MKRSKLSFALQVYVALPCIIASLVFGGLFGGLYLSKFLPNQYSVLAPLILATVGFFLSVWVAVKLAHRISTTLHKRDGF